MTGKEQSHSAGSAVAKISTRAREPMLVIEDICRTKFDNPVLDLTTNIARLAFYLLNSIFAGMRQ